MIALQTKVWQAMNAVDSGTDPIVDPGDGFVYVLNTSNRELGNLIYTKFDEVTRFPDSSWQVRYSNMHTVGQAIYDPLPMRSRLRRIVDTTIPGTAPIEFDPLITPVQSFNSNALPPI